MSLYLGFCEALIEESVLSNIFSIDSALLENNGVSVTGMFLDAAGSPFRYRLDGENPTSSVGHREVPDSQADLSSRITIVGASNVKNFRATSENGVVGTDFTITLAYGA